MNIVQERQRFVQATLVHVPKKITRLYQFGVRVFFFERITSQRANARRTPLKWCTAKTKVFRLVHNKAIVKTFVTLMCAVCVINKEDTIAVDFSDFGFGFQVLLFAKQTCRGRAIPLYFEILRYPVTAGSQNLFVNATVKHFITIVGCTPTFVFDRGFACPSIIKSMLKNNVPFIIRIKKRKRFTKDGDGKLVAAEDHDENDMLVEGYGGKLRLIASDDPSNGNDPWYLITNDTGAAREDIIQRYYHRFEIEEFFRDAKRLLGLEWVRYERPETLATLLWFVCLGTWFAWELAKKEDATRAKMRATFEVSIIRYYLESYEHEILRAAEAYWELQGVPAGG